MYSGAGIYDDGNTGSAVRAVNIIWQQRMSVTTNVSINLSLNELNKKKASKLEEALSSRQDSEKNIHISFRSIEAATLLEKLPKRIQLQPKNTRNLVFIDPYGYKDIDPTLLSKIMTAGKTEIVLFLPIEDMYRFLSCTKESDVDRSFLPLKRFVDSLNIIYTNINSESDFIDNIRLSLALGSNCYCTPYSIKNHNGRLYAMFFLTSNLRGLEKIIEVKWKLDNSQGEGFKGSKQGDFFLEANKLSELENTLKAFLTVQPRNNADIFEFVLKKGFKAKHAVKILKEWQTNNLLSVNEASTGNSARKGTFRLNYNDYNNIHKRLIFELS